MLVASAACLIASRKLRPVPWRRAYDRETLTDELTKRNPDVAIIVPPCKEAIPSSAGEPLSQRDGHILAIEAHGQMAWQKASGYNRRSRDESAIGRYKRVIGGTLRLRNDECRQTEVALGVRILNRMRDMGRATHIRVS